MEVDILLNAGRPPAVAYQARSLTQPGAQSVDFPFADFDSDIQYIDLSDLEKIVVTFHVPPGVDFRVDQIITVIPEPATLGLLSVGGLMLVRRRSDKYGRTMRPWHPAGRRNRLSRAVRINPRPSAPLRGIR